MAAVRPVKYESLVNESPCVASIASSPYFGTSLQLLQLENAGGPTRFEPRSALQFGSRFCLYSLCRLVQVRRSCKWVEEPDRASLSSNFCNRDRIHVHYQEVINPKRNGVSNLNALWE
jgi:hypothetical protein